MSRGFQTRFHQMRTSPRLSWRRSNDIVEHSRRPEQSLKTKTTSTTVSHSNAAAHWFFQNSRISTQWTHHSRIRENPEDPIPRVERRPYSQSQFEEISTSDASKAGHTWPWSARKVWSQAKRSLQGGTLCILRHPQVSTCQTTGLCPTKEETPADSGHNPSFKRNSPS